MSASTATSVASVLMLGLIGGLWFGWAVSVIPGLRMVGDRTYVETMQRINVEIVNPAFILAFVGTPIVVAAAALLEWRSGHQRRAVLLLSALGTYLVGVLGVTFGGNVPLNNALDAFDLDAAAPQALRERRTSYETPWNRFHLARTVANALGFALAALALTVHTD